MKLIAPFYAPKEHGRKLSPLETMLRMYLMQNWFGLSDEGIEDAIYNSYAMKSFLKIDFYIERTPDATTLLHFRHLLDDHSVYGDAGDLGVAKCLEIREDPNLSSVDYRIAQRSSKNRTTKAYIGIKWDRKIEHEKSSIRCKMGHPFLIVKRLFQAGRARYCRSTIYQCFPRKGKRNCLYSSERDT